MSDTPKKPAPETIDEDGNAIRARRNRFVASALAGLTAAATVAACSGDPEANPEPCLSAPIGDATVPPRDATLDTAPQPCLSPIPPDGGDDASDAAGDGDTDADAEPQPCLRIAPDAGGD